MWIDAPQDIAINERLYGKENVSRSATSDPNKEIRKEDLAKIVDDTKFDTAKFLRQRRDTMGTIPEFVDGR
jgi:hypothetical protein